jgi:tRNA dimethylallyltransferase
MKDAVLAIFGPTASGKTAVAEAIAARKPATIVSADSMQVYRGLPLLTAQPTTPTELVGIWDLATEASVGAYETLAHAAVDLALAEGRTPVVAGGTGLYFKAALTDLRLPPPPEPGARERLDAEYDMLGPVGAHAALAARDPEAAARIHPNDRRRVVRALELCEAGASLAPPANALWDEAYRHPTRVIGLDVPRDELERRIVERVHRMFAGGVVDEVRAALAAPLSTTASQVIGLREIVELAPDDAAEAIIVRTRRYAAYQRKWMRRLPGIATVAADRPPGEIADEIVEMERSREPVPAR